MSFFPIFLIVLAALFIPAIEDLRHMSIPTYTVAAVCAFLLLLGVALGFPILSLSAYEYLAVIAVLLMLVLTFLLGIVTLADAVLVCCTIFVLSYYGAFAFIGALGFVWVAETIKRRRKISVSPYPIITLLYVFLLMLIIGAFAKAL